MSGFTAVRAAIFAAGALVGGGVTAYVSNRQQSTSPAPIVGFDKTGKTMLVDASSAPSLLSPVLKYGHFGQY